MPVVKIVSVNPLHIVGGSEGFRLTADVYFDTHRWIPQSALLTAAGSAAELLERQLDDAIPERFRKKEAAND